MSGPHKTWAKIPYSSDEWTLALRVTLKLALAQARIPTISVDEFITECEIWLLQLFEQACSGIQVKISHEHVPDEKKGYVLIRGTYKKICIELICSTSTSHITIHHKSPCMRGSIPFTSQFSQNWQQTMPVEAILEIISNLKMDIAAST